MLVTLRGEEGGRICVKWMCEKEREEELSPGMRVTVCERQGVDDEKDTISERGRARVCA